MSNHAPKHLQQRSKTMRPIMTATLLAIYALTIMFASGSNRAIAMSQDDPPAAALALYREAATLQNANEFELAADVWTTFIDRYPEFDLSLRAKHYLGVCKLQLGDIETARDQFAEVVNASTEDSPFPELEAALLNLGWCHFNLAESQDNPSESYTEASVAFQRLINEFESGLYVDQASYFLGECLYLSGNAAGSVSAYQRVVDDFRDSSLRSNAMYALGVALEDTDRDDDAMVIYAGFLDDYADDPLVNEVRMRVAELTLQKAIADEVASDANSTTSYADAAERFETLSSTDGYEQQDLARFKLAFCLFKQGELIESAETYASVAESFPESSYAVSAALSAGRTYYRAEQYAEAIRWLEQVGNEDEEISLEAAHWICRIHLINDDPQNAFLVANGFIGRIDSDSEYALLLMLDRADAAYELPDRKASAYDLYMEVADTFPDRPQTGQALYYAAFTAFEMEAFDNAITQATRYQTDFSDGPLLADVLSVQGEALLQVKKYGEAAGVFEQLVDLSTRSSDRESWILRQALSLSLDNNDADASTLLTNRLASLESQEALAEAHFQIGSIHFRAGEFQQALTSFEESTRQSTSWRQADDATLMLARAEFRNGDAEAALATISLFFAQHPDSDRSVEAKYREGEFAYATGDFESALAAYQIVLDGNTAEYRPYALDGKAWTLFEQRAYQQAASTFGELIGEFSDHSLARQARYGRAVCCNQIEQYQQALDDLEVYRTQTSDASELANTDFELGIANVGLSNIAEAATIFEQLLANHEDFGRTEQALYELAWCYLDLDQADQAAAPFERLVSEFSEGSNFAEAHFHLGEFDYNANDYDAAAVHYQAAIDNSVNRTIAENALYKLGWTKFHQNDFDAAFISFSAQAEQFEDGALILDAQFMIGECSYQAEQFDKALTQYRLVWPKLEEQGDTANQAYVASTLLHGAQSAIQVQDHATAVEYGEQFVEAFANAQEVPEAWLQVGRGYQGLEQADKAIEALDRAALQSSDHVGAQARFFVGEIYFEQRDYQEAQKQFRRVMLGYGGADATDEVKLFQAMAAFEAGRCADVQIRDASGDERTDLIETATSFYQDVIEKYGDNPFQNQARDRIEALSRLE